MRPAFILKRLIHLALVLTFVFAFASCSKKKAEDESAESTAPISDTEIDGGLADSDSGKAMGLQTIHFAYDSAVLDSKAKGDLNENIRILKDKQNVKVQVEGHCDERGGIQYNIALGERRASGVKAYMVNRGINSDRISIISYGKEKPIDGGHDEEAWAKNRRANFRITEK